MLNPLLIVFYLNVKIQDKSSFSKKVSIGAESIYIFQTIDKCLRINDFILLNDDDLIKRPFA